MPLALEVLLRVGFFLSLLIALGFSSCSCCFNMSSFISINERTSLLDCRGWGAPFTLLLIALESKLFKLALDPFSLSRGESTRLLELDSSCFCELYRRRELIAEEESEETEDCSRAE